MTAPMTFAADTPRSKAGTPLVKIAISRAKRSLFETLAKSTGHRVASGFRANDHHTGSWTFNGRKRRHEITLDPNAHASVNAKLPVTPEQWLAYFTAILRHEVHHGLHTERDLYRVNRECGTHAVPFSSLNVAEDIRIDTLARVTGGAYDWWKYYQPDTAGSKVTEPLAWLVWFKLAEGKWHRLSPRIEWAGVAKVERVRIGKPDGKGQRDAEIVLSEFAAEFAAATSTLSLVPLLRDLFLTFPSAQQDIGKVGGLPSGIVGHGYSYNPSAKRESMHADTVVEVTGDAPDEAVTGLPPHMSAELTYFLGEEETALTAEQYEKRTGRDLKAIAEKGRRVAARLAGLMGTVGGSPSRVAMDGNRLHIGGVMTGDARSFRTSGKRGEKPTVAVLFDQSGSMGADWSRHGASFMAALLLLHQQGRMNVTCVMTGDHKHAVVPSNFPVTAVGRFTCNGGCESIDRTLEAVKRTLQAADIVLVYTDGYLTDGVVNAAQWRSHGVDLIGTAVGYGEYDATTKRKNLTKHFGRAIMAEDGEKLATKIVQYIAANTR